MTVEERNRFADGLKEPNALALARKLFDLLQTKGDRGQIDLVWRLLIPKLQSQLDESEKTLIYRNLESLLMEAELQNYEKSQLIQMLGRTATLEALGFSLGLRWRIPCPIFSNSSTR